MDYVECADVKQAERSTTRAILHCMLLYLSPS